MRIRRLKGLHRCKPLIVWLAGRDSKLETRTRRVAIIPFAELSRLHPANSGRTCESLIADIAINRDGPCGGAGTRQRAFG